VRVGENLLARAQGSTSKSLVALTNLSAVDEVLANRLQENDTVQMRDSASVQGCERSEFEGRTILLNSPRLGISTGRALVGNRSWCLPPTVLRCWGLGS
jgi:hypothetical protein